MQFTKEKMKEILKNHELWLRGCGGERANLREANLREANLREADLHRADLHRADLHGADLNRADLHGADLHGADLREADLYGADLYGADLRWADLHGANLHGANLREADLYGADIDYASWPIWCGSLSVKADSKIVRQLLYHTLQTAINSDIDEELKNVLFSRKLIDQANRFHRVEECGKIILEEYGWIKNFLKNW